MRAASLFLLVLHAQGCTGASLDEVRARHRAGVEAVFATCRELGPALAAEAPRRQAQLDALAPPPSLEVNAAFVHAEDLAAPGQPASVPARSLDTQVLLHCGSLLSRGSFFEPLSPRVNVRAAEAALRRCVELRYLLVIRSADWVPPRANEAQRTFTPGTLSGDVLVVDVATRRVRGGFPFTVTNERTLQVPDGEPQLARLQRNLEAQLHWGLRAELAALAPGAVPPSPLER